MVLKYSTQGAFVNVPDVKYHVQTLDGYSRELVDDLVNDDAIDSALSNGVKNGNHYVLEFDSDTIVIVGNAIAFASVPNFEFQIGDIVRQGIVFATITSIVNSQNFVVDNGDVLSTGQIATVCQAVHTIDLIKYGSAINQDRLFDVSETYTISKILVTYLDSKARIAGNNPDIAFVSSSNGIDYTNVLERPESIDASLSSIVLPSASIVLKLKFFPNAEIGQGNVRLFNYNVIF